MAVSSVVEDVRTQPDFLYPSQDSYDRAREKARQLLFEVLPESSWLEFEDKDTIRVTGRRGVYVISRNQTEIRDSTSGRFVAYACLSLSVPAPTYDRMVAEYLLIKNAEDIYWKTANIFSRCGNEFDLGTMFLAAFDIALCVNLLLTFYAS